MDRITRLTDRLDHNREERDRSVARTQEYRDHISAIREAAEYTRTGFFCVTCDKDFDSDGWKQVRYSGVWPVAWYAGMCPSGHVAMRRITDKLTDPYYYQSKMIQRQRHEMADDLLTPDDPRFKIVYPEKWREMVANKENYERERSRY